MDHLSLTQNFIERCLSGEPFENPEAMLEVMVEHLGFRYFACCTHTDPINPTPGSVALHNYPKPWVEAFIAAELYKSDPVLKFAERARKPFSWNDPGFRAGHTPVQRQILAAASAVGLNGGYTIPIQLSRWPGCQRASFSLVPDGRRNCHDYKLAERVATLVYAAAAYRAKPVTCVTPVELGRRERQCLELAAQGKTDWESSCLLKVSESTVRHYILRATERIGAVTRSQALAYALVTGQISFGDIRIPQLGANCIRDGRPLLADDRIAR